MPTPTTQQLPIQTRAAAFVPASYNAEQRTIDVLWSTGAPVQRYDYWRDERYIEELDISDDAVDLSRLNSGAPLLNNHAAYTLQNQIGVVERAWLDGGNAYATVRLSSRPEVAGIAADIAAGIIRNVSVGYNVSTYEVSEKIGEPKRYRATQWQPVELSFVTVPADAGAGTRADPRTSPCTFIRASEDAMPIEVTETRATEAPAAPVPQIAAAPAAPTADPAAAERQRAVEITTLAQRAGIAGSQIETWLKDGATLDTVRAAITESLIARGNAGPESTRVNLVHDEVDKRRGAQVSALMSRAAVHDPDTKQIVRADRANPYRGATLVDLCRAALTACGVRVDGMSKMELVGRAFTQTASDFPIILENLLNKTLLGSYRLAPDTWSRWCAVGTVSDFRAHNRYQLGGIADLDTLGEGSEFKHKVIPDAEKTSITATTRGNIITLTRQAVINDDLGAFTGLAQAFGRAGKRTIENAVYALLVSNPTVNGQVLFHASRNNIGTAGAPTVTSFDNARSLMAVQKDSAGVDFLDLRPAFWLGPVAIGGAARVVNAAERDPDANNKLERPNSVRGMFRDIIDTPRLTGTQWYAVADPADAALIEVAFLDDQQEPFLEMEEGFDVDGARWKARLDFGVAARDWRAGVRNAGA